MRTTLAGARCAARGHEMWAFLEHGLAVEAADRVAHDGAEVRAGRPSDRAVADRQRVDR